MDVKEQERLSNFTLIDMN